MSAVRCVRSVVGARHAVRTSALACSSQSFTTAARVKMVVPVCGSNSGVRMQGRPPTWHCLAFRRHKGGYGMKEDMPVPQHLAKNRANPWRPKADPSDPEYGTSFTVRRLKRQLYGAMEQTVPSSLDMVEPQPLYAHMRAKTGKYHARHLRGFGYVPAYLQGSTVDEGMNLYINSSQVCREVRRAKYSFQCQIYKLHVAGYKEPMLVLPRMYARNALTLELQNVLFVRYVPGQKYRMQMPIRVIGQEDNVAMNKENASLLYVKRLLDCYWTQPTERICSPPHLVVDIKNLKKGSVVHVSKLQFPEGLKPCNPDINYAILTLKGPRR